jgi:pimeloyl-ACP methyl ester carboxylesterase
MKLSWRGAGAIAIALMGLGLLPPVQARGKAIGTLAEAIGAGFPRPLAPEIERSETRLGGIRGDLYGPEGGDAPGIVILHGAAPKGKDDPRLVRLARSLARAGRTVFVPQLALANEEFDEADIDRIADSVIGLAERRGGEKVSVLGISYGGSFALIAAAREEVAGKIDQLSVFGAYYDLVGLVQAITTGVSVVGEDEIEWEPHPRAREVLHEVTAKLVAPAARAPLERALEGDVPRAQLPPAARRVYDFVTNDDPHATFDIARNLPKRARAVIDRFSPAAHEQEITVPMIAMHSVDDPVTPYGEARRLVHHLPHTRLYTVSLFQHVDFVAGEDGSLLSAARDLFTAWRFTARLLSAQE